MAWAAYGLLRDSGRVLLEAAPRTCSSPRATTRHARRRELERMLAGEFGIEHTTLQVDHEPAPELLEIEGREQTSKA